MTKLTFVDELPKGAVAKSNTNKVFTDEVIEALRENPGKWAKIPDATPQGAAAFVKRMGETEPNKWEYNSVDTGKPSGKKRKAPRTGEEYEPTIKDVYVKYTG